MGLININAEVYRYLLKLNKYAKEGAYAYMFYADLWIKARGDVCFFVGIDLRFYFIEK